MTANLDALAAFAATCDIAACAPEIADKARACLLYGLVVGIASTRADAPRQAAHAAGSEYQGTGTATRLIDGNRLPADLAAYANAALLHARVQEDAHPCGHMDVVVLPAALAIAERVSASGHELLSAIVAGYEVALRIGRDHAAAASERGFRTTSIYGVFGAAAAAARLLRLDETSMRNALALAASFAGGLREFVDAGTDEFPFHAAFAARNGIEAACLAATGVQAAGSALDGAAGFFRAFGGDANVHGRRVAEKLGNEFEFLEIAYKPYPACQFHRGLIHAVLALREQAAAARYERMTVRMNPFEADFFGVRFVGPFSSFPQTFMSAPFCAALAWVHGAVSYAGMHTFDDPAVLAALARVEVIADPACGRYQPSVTAIMENGKSLQWAQAEGAGQYRLNWESAERMMHILFEETGVSPQCADTLTAAVRAIDGARDVRAVVTAAAEGCQQAARVGGAASGV